MGYLQRRELQVLVGTNRKKLQDISLAVAKVYLTQESNRERQSETVGNQNLYVTYRFQKAAKIAECLEGVIRQEQLGVTMGIPMVIMHSPIGRCGKTTLLLDTVKNGTYGQWIYIGMEDYSSFGVEDCCKTDSFWYFLKERKEQALLQHLQEVKGVVGSGTAYFDARRISAEDVRWFKDRLKDTDYRGVVFDVGNGVLESLDVLKEFDYWLIPYVEDSLAKTKMENFHRFVESMDDGRYSEKIIDFDIANTSKRQEIWDRVFGGDIV